MPLLTFSLRWESKLMDGSKRQTIRRNARRWMVNALVDPDYVMRCLNNGWTRVIMNNRSDNLLHIHLTNPRNRHPQHRKLGTSHGDWITMFMRGRDLTDGVAVADGFGTVQELKKGLMETYSMTLNEVNDHIWAVISWSWREGPNP